MAAATAIAVSAMFLIFMASVWPYWRRETAASVSARTSTNRACRWSRCRSF
jgi:cbb3-type cytochrome oxidase subunit 3